jgi:acyl-CoA dehydrogenase
MLTNAMLNNHEEPAVISAIMKQQMTSRMRQVVNDGMDVMGGAGICNGPANFMANVYTNVPIAITVEGANILTRSLIQFGQGLTRSHPHLLHMIQAIEHGSNMKKFNAAVVDIVKHGAKNAFISLTSPMTRSHAVENGVIPHYESQLARLSANFALASDFALSLGGSIKFAEFLSGRYADILSNIYLGYAVLWHYKKFPVENTDAVVEYAMQTLLYESQEALYDISRNFPAPGLGPALRMLTFPFGKCYDKPDDKLIRKVSNAITTDTPLRKQLSTNLYLSEDANDRVKLIHATLPKAVEADKIYLKLRKEKRSPTVSEQTLLDEVEAAREVIIQVDSFNRLGQEEHSGDNWTVSKRPAYTSAFAKVAAASAANKL